jgi:hypothetical protein
MSDEALRRSGATEETRTERAMDMSTRTPEEAVRAYFEAYSGRPELFEDIISSDYLDYGHEPPGRGPQGARDDYDHAAEVTGGTTRYEIDALVTREDTVAAVWTGHLPGGKDFSGLSLYLVKDGMVAELRHAAIGAPPGS